MTKLFVFFFLSVCALTELKGADCADAELLKEFSPIKFLLNVPTPSQKVAAKVQELVARELKEFGKVVSKSVSVQHLMEDKEFLRSPMLIYEIKHVQDVNGESLPILQVVLKCEASLEVSKNAQYGSGILWNGQCFLKENEDVEKMVAQTLPILLKKFEATYLKGNDTSVEGPAFYLIE